MSDTVISVENISKSYIIAHQAKGHTAHGSHLSEKIQRIFTSPFRLLSGSRNDALSVGKMEKEVFWALRDVSFEVKQGEVLGIVGRNGAGKSTLLKILSRITEPTDGDVRIKGRIASLLEVGTGFHPELTGRENIFLNGSILGMSRREIQSKFDEIVDFAEVDKFLDTQVKHYSSGMYVRLAFAVAAHLEPEILVVDEVLAVGDADFQKKCLGKMQNVATGGRTVLFVSHNMAAVRRLCTKGVLLSKGCNVFSGPTDSVIEAYVNGLESSVQSSRQDFPAKEEYQHPSFASIEIRNSSGSSRNTIMAAEQFEIVLTIHNPIKTKFAAVIGVEIMDNEGTSLFTSHSDDVTREFAQLPPGYSTATCVFNTNPLTPGSYNIQLGMVDRQWSVVDFARPELQVRVDDVPHDAEGPNLRRPGRLLLTFPWKLETL